MTAYGGRESRAESHANALDTCLDLSKDKFNTLCLKCTHQLDEKREMDDCGFLVHTENIPGKMGGNCHYGYLLEGEVEGGRLTGSAWCLLNLQS